MIRKERPILRKHIEKLLKEKYSLEDIAIGHSKDYNTIFMGSLKIKARKMLGERNER